MEYLLCIESGTNICSVALCKAGVIVDVIESDDQNYNHAKNLTVFIEEILEREKVESKVLGAVAISKGPGSYTGLRIGVSAAKGICYAAGIPLIALSSLEVMAHGAIQWMANNPQVPTPDLFCPMIDARRMEVYTQLFDTTPESITQIEAKILDQNSFSDYLENKKILFFGNGSHKAGEIIKHKNASFVSGFKPSARFMIHLAWRMFKERKFEDVAYFEPLYLKDFIATKPKNKVLGNQ